MQTKVLLINHVTECVLHAQESIATNTEGIGALDAEKQWKKGVMEFLGDVVVILQAGYLRFHDNSNTSVGPNS